MWENRDIKLVSTKRRSNYLVSELNYHNKRLLAIEIKRNPEILMNKPAHLGLSILELSKILMYVGMIV